MNDDGLTMDRVKNVYRGTTTIDGTVAQRKPTSNRSWSLMPFDCRLVPASEKDEDHSSPTNNDAGK